VHAGFQHGRHIIGWQKRSQLGFTAHAQVLCAKDMLQHCDAVLMLDNDSLLKQAAAKQLKSAASSPGAISGGVGSSFGVTLSDANKVPNV
jgi:hypothetical protein